MVRAWMRATRSDVVGSVIGEEMDSVEGDGEGGGGCCAEVEEDRRQPDTRLLRASKPKTAGPWLLSS
ncbi:hypothetical protein PR202_ga17827 [Eleusine coracana subsp. coracana]|uniref:Uncharacterized protein n=1 Tax=Eleusine coracana subsp. coracana TaxID=191504 RepID=A0AAV5CRB8_ELECO|nr:hypothetical protein PR202_ga17827 [Eleusine coracana subsp. coracana]